MKKVIVVASIILLFACTIKEEDKPGPNTFCMTCFEMYRGDTTKVKSIIGTYCDVTKEEWEIKKKDIQLFTVGYLKCRLGK